MSQILVIDDSPDMRELMITLFESQGYEVKTACEGVAAFAQMKIKLPSLIFLDNRMDGMGGIEFLRLLRLMDIKHIPVVMMTGDQKSVLAGCQADAILQKPVNITELMGLAEALIA